MNILVTVKNEYIIRIKNLLTKLIFDGLNSIYSKTREVSVDDDVLKVFQSLLKRVPKWTDEILNNEVIRIRGILDLDNNFNLLNDLIKASIKATYNIMIFGSDINFDIKNLLDEFNFKDFVRNLYIECSREIYNNPFLFYHNSSPIEIKRNQREVLIIIGTAIEESIRKLLPIKNILDAYLNNNSKIFKVVYPNDILDHNADDNVIDNFVNNDLENDPFKIIVDGLPSNKVQVNLPIPINTNSPKPIQVNSPRPIQVNSPRPIQEINEQKTVDNSNRVSMPVMMGGNVSSVKILNSDVELKNSSENSVQNKIMDIINEKSLNLNIQTNISEFENTNTNSNSHTNSTKSKESIKVNDPRDVNESINSDGTFNDTFMTKDENKKSNVILDSASNKINKIDRSQLELDSKLEKLLKNDLGDSDTESTLVVDNQSNYQEVFSNSNSSHDSSLNSQQKNEEINKNKFFANYLNI